MSNLIQIKRSTANATVTGLANGELAYTQASNTLWIGLPDGSGAAAIAGVRNPGTLTANQALVANSTSAIDKVIVANLVPTVLWANGAAGNNSTFLSANSTGGVYWEVTSSITTNADAQYTWTNTQTFQNTISFNGSILANTVNAVTYTVGSSVVANSSGVYTTGAVNAASHTVGSVFVANTTTLNANGVVVNSTGAYVTGLVNAASYNVGSNFIANSTAIVGTGYANVATSVNSALLTVGTAFVANTTGAYHTGTVNAAVVSVGADFIANTTGAYHTGTVNAASHTVGSNFIANSTAIVGTGYANVATSVNSALLTVGTSFIANTTGAYHTGTVNAASLTVGSNFIANSTKVTFTGANIDATSAFLKVADIVVSGNATISGTVTTINTQQITVNDNIIELAYNNTTTDVVDTGLFSPAGNSSSVWYSGIARVAAWSANNNAVYRVFASNTNPNTSSTIDTSSNTATSTIVAYLAPYASSSSLGGAFVANSTAVNITANSTVSSALVANSLTLTTALAAASGGTGQSSYSTGDLLYASGATALSKLSVTANGEVLQVINNLPAYGTLDGGTF